MRPAVVLPLVLLAGCVDARTATSALDVPPAAGTADDLVFVDGFETGLIPPWTGKQVAYPVNTIGESPFNEVERTRGVVRSGDHALRTFAKWSRAIDPHPAASTVSKADIFHNELDFRPGDHEWFSGWFRFADAPDVHGVLIADFEAPNAGDISPGLRLITPRPDLPGGPAFLHMNAKGFGESLPPINQVPVPIATWFHLVVHIELTTEDGLIQVWQDDELIIEGRRPTIPTLDAVYSSVQVGLTANGGFTDHTLFVDDVALGRTAEAIGWAPAGS